MGRQDAYTLEQGDIYSLGTDYNLTTTFTLNGPIKCGEYNIPS
jgi:hypothetical protein